MIKAILIDDENSAINALSTLLTEYFDFVEVIATANSVDEGYKVLTNHTPDIIFLDVEMPDGTGFDLLKRFSSTPFKVIFVTAYSEYAIKAIKEKAFDYLLKPIDINELTSTLQQLKGSIKPKSTPSRISVPCKNGHQYLKTDHIIKIAASGSYCKIYLTTGENLTVSSNLKHFEQILCGQKFYRCHHSYIVNLDKVVSVINDIGAIAVLEDDSQVDISKRKKHDFIEHMEKYTQNQ